MLQKIIDYIKSFLPEIKSGWLYITTHAWSAKLLIIAALLSGLEVVLPLAGGYVPKLLVFAVVAAAFVARISAQSSYNRDMEDKPK